MRGIEDLGYRRSCKDPCIFCLMDDSGRQGYVLIEVDDLATHGSAVHAENHGEWKSICNSEGECAGRTVIQDQSYGFHIHQAKFVRERLSPIVIPQGPRSDKKSETSNGEKKAAASRVGVLSIGFSERPVQMCQLWYHVAWVNQPKHCARFVRRQYGSGETEGRTVPWNQASPYSSSQGSMGYHLGRFLSERCRGSHSRSFFGWCNFG